MLFLWNKDFIWGFVLVFFLLLLLFVFKSTTFLMFTQNYFPGLSSGENVNGIEKQLVNEIVMNKLNLR